MSPDQHFCDPFIQSMATLASTPSSRLGAQVRFLASRSMENCQAAVLEALVKQEGGRDVVNFNTTNSRLDDILESAFDWLKFPHMGGDSALMSPVQAATMVGAGLLADGAGVEESGGGITVVLEQHVCTNLESNTEDLHAMSKVGQIARMSKLNQTCH